MKVTQLERKAARSELSNGWTQDSTSDEIYDIFIEAFCLFATSDQTYPPIGQSSFRRSDGMAVKRSTVTSAV
jgi:hypothetical protein